MYDLRVAFVIQTPKQMTIGLPGDSWFPWSHTKSKLVAFSTKRHHKSWSETSKVPKKIMGL